ncbi:hypothetical protein BCR44DRAFT_1048133 [Catenaria anguillulae PL171]|uniref:Uncharacterized protein n=1 Tax=Catenaria anguillulae PL171 TaxID=765915 RepID=A0A1Y2H9E6_9FUNG|nr:hypothetical protein BCR44DRAFT_1048133 [Catenaria anguillulae PL171]
MLRTNAGDWRSIPERTLTGPIAATRHAPSHRHSKKPSATNLHGQPPAHASPGRPRQEQLVSRRRLGTRFCAQVARVARGRFRLGATVCVAPPQHGEFKLARADGACVITDDAVSRHDDWQRRWR